MAVEYAVRDWFTTSRVEGKRNEYRRLVADLDGLIARVERDLSDVMADVAAKFNAFHYQDSSQGRLVTEYVAKVDVVESRFRGLLSALDCELLVLREKRSIAAARLEITKIIRWVIRKLMS